MTAAASKLTASAAVLLVKDVVAAANHYRDAMGFAYDEFHGDPPCFVILGRDKVHLMLRQADPRNVVPHKTVGEETWDIYFWVDDIEALYADCVRRGARISCELCDQSYGCREFAVRDLDGHEIGFGQVMNPKR